MPTTATTSSSAKPQTVPADTRALVIERALAHAPAKVWRALTEGALLGEWLLPNDFRAEVGAPFTLRSKPVPGWDGVIAGEVLEVHAPTRLSYTWVSMGLATVVTYTLTPTSTGTQLRMEQSGFPVVGGDQYFGGAQYGWNAFFGKLEGVLDGLS